MRVYACVSIGVHACEFLFLLVIVEVGGYTKEICVVGMVLSIVKNLIWLCEK